MYVINDIVVYEGNRFSYERKKMIMYLVNERESLANNFVVL